MKEILETNKKEKTSYSVAVETHDRKKKEKEMCYFALVCRGTL
jgi:hypothetical protein